MRTKNPRARRNPLMFLIVKINRGLRCIVPLCVLTAVFLIVVPRSHALNCSTGTAENSSSVRSSIAAWHVKTLSVTRTQNVGSVEREVRDVVERLFNAINSHNVESYLAIWSENSPSYAQKKSGRLAIESGKVVFTNPQFSRFAISGERATVRVMISSRTITNGEPPIV